MPCKGMHAFHNETMGLTSLCVMIHSQRHKQRSFVGKLEVIELSRCGFTACSRFRSFQLITGWVRQVFTLSQNKSYGDSCFVVYTAEGVYCRVSCSIMTCIVTSVPLLSVISTLFIRREALNWRAVARELGGDKYWVTCLKFCNRQVVSSALDSEINSIIFTTSVLRTVPGTYHQPSKGL